MVTVTNSGRVESVTVTVVTKKDVIGLGKMVDRTIKSVSVTPESLLSLFYYSQTNKVGNGNRLINSEDQRIRLLTIWNPMVHSKPIHLNFPFWGIGAGNTVELTTQNPDPTSTK